MNFDVQHYTQSGELQLYVTVFHCLTDIYLLPVSYWSLCACVWLFCCKFSTRYQQHLFTRAHWLLTYPQRLYVWGQDVRVLKPGCLSTLNLSRIGWTSGILRHLTNCWNLCFVQSFPSFPILVQEISICRTVTPSAAMGIIAPRDFVDVILVKKYEDGTISSNGA